MGRLRDGFAMRIELREIQVLFKLADNARAENMLYFLRILVDMILSVISFVGKVELPQAVVANNAAPPANSERRSSI